MLFRSDEGQYDAIVLAAAGLKRLGLGERIRAHISTEQMLPAAGQGALGLEIRASDTALRDAMAPLAHLPTWLVCTAERAVSRALGGSCSMPLAAHATVEAISGDTHRLHLRALLGNEQQAGLLRAEQTAEIRNLAEAEALGLAVAQALKAQAPAGWLPTC